MTKYFGLLCGALLLVGTLAGHADYEADYKAAEALWPANKTGAIQAFVDLAGSDPDPVRQSDCLRRAALMSFHANQSDQAMALALRIPDAALSKATRMWLMNARRQWKEVVETFGAEPIETWPDSVRGEAFRSRGEAAFQAGNGALAEKDLIEAGRLITFDLYKAGALLTLGDTYRTLLKDDEKAIASYRRAFSASSRLQTRAPAVCGIAGIFLKRKQTEAALAELDRVDVTALDPKWQLTVLDLRGQVLAAAGHNRAAAAVYRQILTVAGLSPEQRARFEQAATQLLMESKEDVVLAAGSKSEHQIVVPDRGATPGIDALLLEAAGVVSNAFAANGAQLPVVRESERDPAKPGIYLGDTAFARARKVDLAALQGWSYVMRTVGKDVIIAGRDTPNPAEAAGEKDSNGQPIRGTRLATLKGVADFLRQYVGTRFLHPEGDVGIEFIRTPAIAVPAGLDVTVRPQLRFHCARTYGGYGVATLHGSRSLYLVANNFFPITDLDWKVHSYDRAIPVETYRKSHPEYFALIGNRRIVHLPNIERMSHYCLSNKEVQELIYRDLLNWLDRGYDMTVLGQQDGFRACQCPDCHALYGTGEDWTEKLWIFHRNLAARLLKDRPGKKVLLLSYGHTWEPPKTFKAFPSNAIVLLCRMTPELLAQWAGCDVPGGYAGYLYLWGTYNHPGYTPQRTPLTVGALAKQYHALGLQALYLDGFGQSFGLEGPSYYVFGRMFDDPGNLTTKDLLEEYCQAAFQEAVTPMRRFFDTLHHALQFYGDKPSSYEDVGGIKRTFFSSDAHKMKLMGLIYSPDVLADLETHLGQAEKLAVAPKVKSRLALVRLEFNYARHIATVAHLWNAYRVAPDLASRNRLLDAVDAWNAFLGPHWFRWDAQRGAWGSGQLAGQIPGWPECRPFLGHSRHAVALTELYKDTPLNWDTAAMRRAPLPGGQRLTAVRTDGPVSLDSPGWDAAPAVRLGRFPGDAGDPRSGTTVRMQYGIDRLYLRVDGDLPDGAAATYKSFARAADATTQESLEIVLAPLPDREKFYRFLVGPNPGSRLAGASGFIDDTLHPLYGKEDPAWPGAWTCETRIASDKRRWQALLTVSFKTLGVEPVTPGTVWRANFGRIHVDGKGRTERSVWSAKPETRAVATPDAFGDIAFLAAGASAESPESPHPISRRREALYQSTFAVSPEWKGLPNLLPASAWGPWKFREDPADKGVTEAWFGQKFQDADWMPIAVPAFWAETAAGAYTGIGWYRTTLTLPLESKGRPLRLLFGAADEQAWVYVNGTLVGEHSTETEKVPAMQLWDKPFVVEVAPARLVHGGTNVLAIRLHNSAVNGGLWRPVLAQVPATP